ncbi:MAG: S9 family peptidase [Pseudomonadota bacterium]
MPILRITLTFLVSIYVWSGLLLAPAAAAQQPSLDDFLSDPEFWKPELSPNGRYVALISKSDGETKQNVVLVTDLDTRNAKPVSVGFGKFRVNWIEWANDDRLLVSLTGYKSLITNELVSPYDNSVKGLSLPVSRIVAINRDGKDLVTMFNNDRRMGKNFSLAAVTNLLPNDSDHILMPAYLGADLDLFKVNVNTGEHERIAIGTPNTYYWYTDKNGEPAFRYNVNSRRTVVSVFAREDKANGKIRWKKIQTIRINRDNDDSASVEFKPLSPGPTSTTYFVAARPEGADTVGIYLYDFESQEFLETIASRDGLDIQRGIFDSESGAYLGAVYWDDNLVIELKDKSIQRHLNGLSKYFGQGVNVLPIDSSGNGQKWLLLADGPTEPGTFHVYDVEKTFVKEIAVQYSSLLGKRLSKTQAVRYPARDGLLLRGYLTRPSFAKDGDTPPLIVMPHGGPEMRDYIEYDPLVQYLASLGYQVFQPNFRGSSGFGKAFAEKGRRQFGKAMQTDVMDGYAYLIEKGYAAPGNACILGFSYGGYVAMAAATFTPDQFKCVIAGAGMSDLLAMLKWERKEEGRTSEAYKYWVEQIGDPKQDREAIEAVSPVNFVERIKAPMLLIHGEKDRIVPIAQSELMAEALSSNGKPFEFVRLKRSAHSFRPPEELKQEFQEITEFLEENLAP